MSERWKDAVGYINSQVSNLGRVRSRYDKKGRLTSTWRVIARSKASGYVRFWFRLPNGRKQREYLHRLVLLTFVGPPPTPAHQARHIRNNDKHDCRLSNLAWGSAQENMEDKGRHGTLLAGDTSPMMKVTDNQVAALRRKASDLSALGTGRYELLAKECGISTDYVRHLIHGRYRRTPQAGWSD